jgi:hypothetical protein
MKTIFGMCLLIPSLVFANPQVATVQTLCVDAEQLSATTNEFKEIPFVRGITSPLSEEDKRLSLVVFLNPTTGTFTIVEKAADNLYCILAVGNNFQPVPQKIQDDVRQEQEKGKL